MLNAKLAVNGKEFPINYRMLSGVARMLPNETQYSPLAHGLLELGIPSITRDLVSKENVLSTEDRDAIWEKGNIDLKRLLAEEDTFRKNMTDAQAEEIIVLNDREILEMVAAYAEELYPAPGNDQAMRLSGKMADALLEFIAKHPDGGVREKLAENSQAPAKYRPAFVEIARNGLRIGNSYVANLKPEDLECLGSASLDTLDVIANSIEDIEDKSAQQKVADFICAHPDPGVRLELAENRWAPNAILQRLTNDPDADVVLAAQESLAEK